MSLFLLGITFSDDFSLVRTMGCPPFFCGVPFWVNSDTPGEDSAVTLFDLTGGGAGRPWFKDTFRTQARSMVRPYTTVGRRPAPPTVAPQGAGFLRF